MFPYQPREYSRDRDFYARAQWTLSFAWLPKTCNITGKKFWLCMGYQGTAVWFGTSDAIIETRWHKKNEHLIFQLKGYNYV